MYFIIPCLYELHLQVYQAQPVIDAIRVHDNTPVMLKKVFRPGASEDDEEEDIALYLSSPELLNDPRNHAVPIYDVLQIHNDNKYDLLVMPLLRPFDSPRFDTIGECMDFFRQIFQASKLLDGLNVLLFLFNTGPPISASPSYRASV
jgi:hypothetical protein